MEEKKVQSIIKELNVVGLTDNDLEELGSWYACFTNKRSKGFYNGAGYTIGSPIVNKRTIKKGLMFLSSILNELDEFDSPLIVEPLNKKNCVCFKCINKSGENLVIYFTSGDLIDYPTEISIIGQTSVKRAYIMLGKGILLDKLSYYNLRTQAMNEYYQAIYNEAYGDETKIL